MADFGVYFSHELREIWKSANEAQTGDSSSEQLKNLTSELGQKTVGILKFPVKWTIEKFAVIGHGACKDFLLSNSTIEIDKAIQLVVSYFETSIPGFEFIVRSSAANESLLARGKYKSTRTGNSFDSIRNGVYEVLRSFKGEAGESITSNHFSVLIHQYYPADFHGHLSNERRVGFCHYFNEGVTGSKRSFLAEVWEGDGDEPKDTFTLQSKKEVSEPSQEASISIDDKTCAKALREMARWVHKRIGRGHLEWIAHSGKLLVVQCDVESETPVKEPLYLWRSHSGNFDASRLKVFALATKENCSDLRKTRSKLVFQACSLPVAPLYLLRSESEIEAILSGDLPEMTNSDLRELAEYPLSRPTL